MTVFETATFGGGCFWCTEALFQRLKGVVSATSGYAGGTVPHPTYEQVSSGETGHAEVVNIVFDPDIISYTQLLEVFFAIHDPTTINRQGADIGTQYRSIVLYHNDKQKNETEAAITMLERSGQFEHKIVTEIEPFTDFYEAENYHQNYYEHNRNVHSYCPLVIDPKIQKLLDTFSEKIKEEYL